jgi:hypothetical protein
VRSAGLLETIVAIILLLCETALASDAYVILVRGWFGVFSKSLDSIAQQLRAQNIEAQVAGHLKTCAMQTPMSALGQ